MPTIRVDLFEGRTHEQKKNFVKALTQACVDAPGSKPESVDVILYDIKPSDWATGGGAAVGKEEGLSQDGKASGRAAACRA
ncbi:4-oxalocrotonate tautomerase [Ramlibacter terrae]|uniref:4-oxalocrotonate tautomerase n=1 Tax=Ramlibacter terrae TaxID=2732511 RepID=A0ABX6P1V2_9BURK|nr:4-oxalocrotonate tautomerase [Ramlibacter terrae]